MAGYDIFSQPTGPVRSISLFGDATSAGINAGHALPSTTTSIIKGVTQGVKTGQEIVQGFQTIEANDQNQQIRQHQIDRQPQADAAQDANTDAQVILNDINKNKAKIGALTQDSQIKIAKQESDNKLAEVTQQHDDINTASDIAQALTDPGRQASILTDPKNQGYLLRNPKEGQQVVGALQRQGAITEEQANSYNETFDSAARSQVLKAQERLAEQQREHLMSQRDSAFKDAYTDPEIADITRQITPQTAGSLRTELHTEVVTNPDGTSKTKQSTGQWDVYLGDKKISQKPLESETAVKKLNMYGMTSKAYDEGLKAHFGVKDINTPSGPQGDSSIKGLGDAPAAAPATPQGTEASTEKPADNAAARLAQERQRKNAQFNPKDPTELKDAEKNDVATAVKKDTAAGVMRQGRNGYPAEMDALSPEELVYRQKHATPVEKQIQKVPQLAKYDPVYAAVSAVENPAGDNSIVSHYTYGPKKGQIAAVGIMQVTPDTFKYVVDKYGAKVGLNEFSSIYDADSNIKAGTTYLAEQIVAFGNEPGNGLELALAAYNAGPAPIAEALKRARANNNATWEGVKNELHYILGPHAYEEATNYPDLVLGKLYNYTPKKKKSTNV